MAVCLQLASIETGMDEDIEITLGNFEDSEKPRVYAMPGLCSRLVHGSLAVKALTIQSGAQGCSLVTSDAVIMINFPL